VRNCTAKIKAAGYRFNAIVCNAGIMATPTLQRAHGYELQFFTNHIGHFMLVTDLLDHIAEEGRVVVVTSSYHRLAPRVGIRFDNLTGERGYNPWVAYGQSKMANILFANELQRRFSGSNKTAYSVHPGIIPTNLARSTGSVAQSFLDMLAPLFLKTIPQGAATQVFAAVHPAAKSLAGRYLADCNTVTLGRRADNPELARKLWKVSEQIVQEL
jgi:WW domain-containing oxidoreductase